MEEELWRGGSWGVVERVGLILQEVGAEGWMLKKSLKVWAGTETDEGARAL